MMMMFKDVNADYPVPADTLTPTKLLLDSAAMLDSTDCYLSEMNPFDQNSLIQMSSNQNEQDLKKQRKKLLEKNREAAYRCRQKKKKYINDLEERSKLAEVQNKELQQQISQLRDESIYLRSLLLSHGSCDCEVVQAYLRRTSEQLSHSMITSPLINNASSSSNSSINSIN